MIINMEVSLRFRSIEKTHKLKSHPRFACHLGATCSANWNSMITIRTVSVHHCCWQQLAAVMNTAASSRTSPGMKEGNIRLVLHVGLQCCFVLKSAFQTSLSSYWDSTSTSAPILGLHQQLCPHTGTPPASLLSYWDSTSSSALILGLHLEKRLREEVTLRGAR